MATRRYTPRIPREERAEQILDAAVALLVRDGFAALTMDRLAGEAGIAKSVVYAIFGSREGLLDALVAREGRRAEADADAAVAAFSSADDPATGIGRAFTRFLQGVDEHPDTWRLLLRPPSGLPPAVRELSVQGRERWWRRLEPLAGQLLERAGLQGLDPVLTAHLFRGSAEYLALLMLDDPGHFNRDRIAAYATELTARVAAPTAP